MSKTIIVSNRLPVRAEKAQDGYHFIPSEGGLATGLGSIYKEGENVWLGWPGKVFDDKQDQRRVSEELKGENMAPVFLNEADLEGYYLGFSNQTLWPAFHYFVQYIEYHEEQWQSYIEVNRKFADAILAVADKEDVIWVHDYQLMLVPQMLREELPNASIGFFQHIPFPSYEIFRMLPWRKELLEGMLGSDFIAFHTYDDMRHFLSSVHRLTDFMYRNNTITVKGRRIEVDALPMGIDYKKYAEQAREKQTLQYVQKYKEAIGEGKVILSVDRLDYSKGIPDRLIAFRRFLEENPSYHGKVSLIMIVVPSRHQVPSYGRLKDDVDELVGKINGYFADMNWRPIHYFYRSFPLAELSAFYVLSDIALITPIRDGMNLVCKEYIASRTQRDGVLILSEMAGSAKELSESILVNPNDQQALTRSIKEALEMDSQEAARRMAVMQETLQNYNIFHWVDFFYENLREVKKKQTRLHYSSLNDQQKEELKERYQKAEKRLILLDYDGTLVPFQSDPEKCVPDVKLREILEKLIYAKNTKVAIISGRPAEFLERVLGEYPIDMAAEHGIWFKSNGGDWEINPDLPSDNYWKDDARTVINFYVDRTPGSFLEEKKNSLVWHYRKVDAGLAAFRSSELNSHLKHMMAEKEIEVMAGNNIIEVKPMASNKGKAALRLKKTYAPDFILAAGDDRTDEYIFEALGDKHYTIKVGNEFTRARMNVSDPEAVRQLLSELADLD